MWFRQFPTFGLPVFFGLILVAGCDGGGSKRASQAQQLSGTWDVDCVYIDNFSCQGFRSERTVRLEIEQGKGQKTYRIFRRTTDGTETVSGAIEILSNNRMGMTGEYLPGPLAWKFDFQEPNPLESSVRIRLRSASSESRQAFLEALGKSGGASSLALDLGLLS